MENEIDCWICQFMQNEHDPKFDNLYELDKRCDKHLEDSNSVKLRKFDA